MIPISLRVRNFMSYGEGVEPLDFSSFQIACLCGENGHGKSALLDAITWALWGRSRARSEDDLVQLGKLDMEVELEFALGDARYCVLRKRSLKTSGRRRIAVPTLELQLADGEGYRPMTGESVGQTQAIIQGILRIDYETFINSAFIVQGRADEFTLKSPAERKKVLADLLGLDRYGQLEERAREESRRCQSERQAVLGAIAEIDVGLSRRGEYELALSVAAERIARAAELRRLADAELTTWRAQQREAQQQAAQLEEFRRRRAQDQRELATLEAQQASEQREVARLQKLVAGRAEIEARAARLAELRKREEQLGRAAGEMVELTQDRARLEQAISAAREGIAAELKVAGVALLGLESLLAQQPALAQELARAEAELAALAKLDVERESARRDLQEVALEARAHQDANERLRVEMAEMKERLAMLGKAGAACPVCRGELNPKARAEMLAQTEGEGKVKGNEFRANAAAIKVLETRRAEVERVVRAADARLAGRGAAEGRVATLRQNYGDAEAGRPELEPARARVAELEARLAGGGFLPTEESALAAILGRIAATGYDRAEHARIRDEVATLRGVEVAAAEVAAAVGALPLAVARLSQATDMLDARRKTIKALDDQIAKLAEEVAHAAEVDGLVRRASDAVDAAITESTEANRLLGITQQQIEHCRHLERERAERVATAGRAGDEKALYDELALAFGKKGIQAMIIENAIPEIEDEANLLLARLTDGQLNLTFETQRDAKFGDNVIETLDIKISDSYGTRTYEMYSGGEAFRINFAIRIALSKLLARRAGAQLQLLVIDEGFGTQDATGRDRLVEAISAVASDFEKILVVTHIQELKDAFPVRIDVVKGPEGSRIAAATVLDG